MTPSFETLNLPAPILKALAKNDYLTPTPIQAQSIPLALAGHDLLLSAQTGSGKTAAFLLPILSRLIEESNQQDKNVKALILVPTRELAQQIQTQVKKYGKELKWLFCTALVGGSSYREQIFSLKKGVQIVIATPGRLLDHMADNRLDFNQLQTLVLDEADRMLDMGFTDDLNEIMKAMPAERQTIMSSATWDGNIAKLVHKYTTNPEKITIKAESAHIEERVYFCDNQQHKNQILDVLISDPEMGQTLIFTATKSASEEVADYLRDNGHRARFMHGDLPQVKRNRIVDDLRKGKCDILVATDVVARGIDVPTISHVINYDLPRHVEDYVHRIGRSGRAGRTGTAINLCSMSDRSALSAISHYINREIDEFQIEGLEPQLKPKAKAKPKKKFRGAPSKEYKSASGGKKQRFGDQRSERGERGRDKFAEPRSEKSFGEKRFEQSDRKPRFSEERSDKRFSDKSFGERRSDKPFSEPRGERASRRLGEHSERRSADGRDFGERKPRREGRSAGGRSDFSERRSSDSRSAEKVFKSIGQKSERKSASKKDGWGDKPFFSDERINKRDRKKKFWD